MGWRRMDGDEVAVGSLPNANPFSCFCSFFLFSVFLWLLLFFPLKWRCVEYFGRLQGKGDGGPDGDREADAGRGGELGRTSEPSLHASPHRSHSRAPSYGVLSHFVVVVVIGGRMQG